MNQQLNRQEEEKKAQVKVNHYKEMGLENTNILRKIADMVGF